MNTNDKNYVDRLHNQQVNELNEIKNRLLILEGKPTAASDGNIRVEIDTDKVYEMYILTEKWAGLSFKNGPPERAYKVNKIMRRCHCSDLVFNHLLSLFEPV